MPDYKDAPEVRAIAEELIAEYHPHLVGKRIAYAFSDKAGRKNGKTVLGTASIESGKSVFFAAGAPSEYQGGKFFLMTISEPNWRVLKREQRLALVDHELAHMGKDPETGEVCLWPHDIEEFTAVVERHGLWMRDVQDFVEAVTASLEPELPFADVEDAATRPYEGDDDERTIRIAALRAYHERYLDDASVDPDDGILERLGRDTAERIDALVTGVGYVPADDCALLGRWNVVYPDVGKVAGIPVGLLVAAAAEHMPGSTFSVENGVPTITVPGD